MRCARRSRRGSGRPRRRASAGGRRSTVPVDADQAETLFKLLETLDDNDDVQRVVSNVEFDDAVLERLSA